MECDLVRFLRMSSKLKTLFELFPTFTEIDEVSNAPSEVISTH